MVYYVYRCFPGSSYHRSIDPVSVSTFQFLLRVRSDYPYRFVVSNAL